MPLPTSPDALRDLVLKLQKKEAEFTFRISEQEQAITLRDETIARLENTLAKVQRRRYAAAPNNSPKTRSLSGRKPWTQRSPLLKPCWRKAPQ